MSGIAGLVGPPQSDGSQGRTRVEAMLSQLRHRGPDSFVVQAWDHVCLGHARLSTGDLQQEDNQPLSHGDGRCWIVLDGEIYNFVELRDRLEGLHHAFQTNSDAEVILAAFERWGADSLLHFNGVWAFAIYDRRERACFVARDRFGVKPLYYALDGDALLFASEMKALLAAGVPAEPNLETMRSYLHDEHHDRGDLTPFKTLHQLPAGHYLIARNGEQTIHRWWETLAHRVDVPSKFSDRTERFRELLEDAVRIRLRGDVKPAVTLSGGMDSSSIYALYKALHRPSQLAATTDDCPGAFLTFTVSFPGQAIDESSYVEHLLGAYGDHGQYVHATPAMLPQLLNETVWHQESFTKHAAVGVYHIFYRRIAEAGTRVILEGHGSDEMLAGYTPLVRAALRSFLARADWRAAWQAARCLFATINPARFEGDVPAWVVYARHVPFVGRGVSEWQRRVQRLRKPRRGGAPRRRIVRSDYLSSELLVPPQRDTLEEEQEDLDPLGLALYDGFHWRWIPTELRVWDRATMASSIKCRMPFMDHRLVQYVFSLPASDTVGAGESKHILREAMRDVLPVAIVNRRKKTAFLPPLLQWFNDPALHNHLAEIVHDPAFAEHGLIDGDVFAAYFDNCLESGFGWADTTRVWEVVNLSLWWQVFVSRRIQVGQDGFPAGR
jgi:asparagine synthase (glutamine-hydrolysing)